MCSSEPVLARLLNNLVACVDSSFKLTMRHQGSEWTPVVVGDEIQKHSGIRHARIFKHVKCVLINLQIGLRLVSKKPRHVDWVVQISFPPYCLLSRNPLSTGEPTRVLPWSSPSRTSARRYQNLRVKILVALTTDHTIFRSSLASVAPQMSALFYSYRTWCYVLFARGETRSWHRFCTFTTWPSTIPTSASTGPTPPPPPRRSEHTPPYHTLLLMNVCHSE